MFARAGKKTIAHLLPFVSLIIACLAPAVQTGWGHITACSNELGHEDTGLSYGPEVIPGG